MPGPKTITLPQSAEMKRRLIAVDGNQYVVNRFYPIILRSAGKQHMSGEDVVRMLVEAIDTYTSHEPTVKMLRAALEEYVTVLIDDERVLRDAHAMIDEQKL